MTISARKLQWRIKTARERERERETLAPWVRSAVSQPPPEVSLNNLQRARFDPALSDGQTQSLSDVGTEPSD